MPIREFQISRRGFTLVEMLIAIAILSIITVVSMNTLVNSRKSADAVNSCNMIATMINKTRNYALVGQKDGAGVPSQFTINISGSTVRISGNSVMESQTLNVPAASAVSLSFSVPKGDPTPSGTTTVTFSNTSRKVVFNGFRAECQ